MININEITKKQNIPTLIAMSALLWLMYQTGMLDLWINSEEYGHGLMVVGLLGYILYRRRASLVVTNVSGQWVSLLIAVFALALIILGQASGIGVLSMYGVWLFASAILVAYRGVSFLLKFATPLLIVFLLIPLPNPFGPMLTSGLQLLSSQLGVWFIRLFGGTVYLEGNVIDMGGVQLLVAEACSGLRYLFPLMSLGAIAGYMLTGPLWMRWFIFLVTIPITVVLNSLRVGLTGILTEKWGTQHTQGLLHFFEGWVVFMVATLLLMLVCWIVLKLYDKKLTMTEAFAVDLPSDKASNQAEFTLPMLPVKTGGWLALLLLLASVISPVLLARVEVLPARQSFVTFPQMIGTWAGKESRLPAETEAVAGASEYYYGDFTNESDATVNLYVSFYKTQRNGKIPHSPKVCIPGDGWVIESNVPVELKSQSGRHIVVNRLLITKGENRTISYYWLKQGSKAYREELLARLDLVRFSLLNSRTDGALVRLVTQVGDKETLSDADARLLKFSETFLDVLPNYVPD